MSRLFLTPRELNFISDITKEIVRDVIGTRIYYYAINENRTKVDGVYNEATQKVFDAPVIIDCIVDSRYQEDTKIDSFGIDQRYKLEAFVQYRDIVDKGLTVSIGDFFSFSDVFYEVTEVVVMRNVYGLPEHRDGVKLVGTKARAGQFDAVLIGPTDYGRPETDAVQTTFEQQRGQASNSEGLTGDRRELQRDEVVGPPITGAKAVSPDGDTEHSGVSSFFDNE